MNINIKKIIAIGIGLSVMNSAIVPVFASDINNNVIGQTKSTDEDVSKNKKLLSLQDAVDSAIENSAKLELKSKEIILYKDKIKIQSKKDDVKELQDKVDEDFPYDKLELEKKQKRQEKQFLEDQIENDIINKYNDLVLGELELNKIEKNLKTKEKDLEQAKLKQKLGLATNIQSDSMQLDVQNLKNDKKAKEDLLKIKKEYFGILTDLNLDDYTLDHDLHYEKLNLGEPIDGYIDDKIDLYFKYNDQIIELTSDYSEDMEDVSGDEPEKPEYNPPSKEKYKNEDGSYDEKKYKEDLEAYSQQYAINYNTKLQAYGQYLELKYASDSSKVTMSDSKDSLRNGLKESYANLMDLENKIESMKQQNEIVNKQLSNAKLQYDLGLITLNEYNKQSLQSEELSIAYRNLVNSHDMLKRNIQKPWLISSSNNLNK